MFEHAFYEKFVKMQIFTAPCMQNSLNIIVHKSWHQTAEIFRRIGRGKIGVKYTLLIFDKNLEEILDIKGAMNWGGSLKFSGHLKLDRS